MHHQTSSDPYESGSGRHSRSLEGSCLPSGSVESASRRRSPNAGRLRKGRGKGRAKLRSSGQQTSSFESTVTSRLRSRRGASSGDGSCAGSTKQTNGVSCNGSVSSTQAWKGGKAAGASPKRPPTFSETDLEIVRLIGQHLRNLGLE